MQNQSGLEPLGVAVLIQPYEPERKESLIVVPDEIRGKMAMVDSRAVVVAVGPSAWHDEPAPRAKPGDKVLVTKYSGFMVEGPKDGQRYRLVNDRDIFCAIKEEK